jgi:hypothetical protein
VVPAGPITVKPDWWQRLVAIGSVLSVLLVAVGLYVTNEANREQQRLTAQGQITDRFTKAVEQLGQSGPEKVDMRLGAIYALERIMRDSAVDQAAVIDILAAFIRVHAPAPTMPGSTVTPASYRLPVDIQAALTVLGRRDATRGGDKPGPGHFAFDLANVNLAHADLAHANLTNVNLTSAHLTEADLADAHLDGARLNGADLTGARLNNAYLNNATNLSGADLTDASLSGADLTGANLTNATLTRTYLNRANLSGAYLSSAKNLNSANLGCARTDDRTQLPAGVDRPASCG